MFRSKEKFIITAIRRATPAADPARETGFKGAGGNRRFQRKKALRCSTHILQTGLNSITNTRQIAVKLTSQVILTYYFKF